jgi:phosphonate metabolism-associated iron-containing alcohol dehydrogenase
MRRKAGRIIIVTHWTYNNPVKIIFGAGSFDRINRLIDGRRYCIVTYGESYFSSLIDRLALSAGKPTMIVKDVAPNPDFALLIEQAPRFSSLPYPPEVIVALGGGSVIDTAKVLASCGDDFERVKTFLISKTGEDSLLQIPIIAVPTTAGTGSEVTCWGTVWDSGSQHKYSLARTSLYPSHAVIDPSLMLGKSRDLTISTGLDALSHALESLWNVNANPVSAACAVSAATEILNTLPRLVDELQSLPLRTRVAKAALMSGMAFSNTKTAIAHSISYPITLRHDVVHGIACSFTLPFILASVAGTGGLCGSSLKQIFGEDLTPAPGRLTKFLETLGVSTDPRDHGVSHEEWNTIVDTSFKGERGLNFIGTREKLVTSAETLAIL